MPLQIHEPETTDGLDLVVWGATGYTGRLVADYVASHAPASLRWAVAGRNLDKLEKLRVEIAPAARVVTADAADAASLDAMVGRTRVVLSTVGPYALHGTPLVEACVRRGVDYCDITGEPQWIRGNIDRFHRQAARTRARIVHCCGFDSIPSDVGVWMLHEHLRSTGGEGQLKRVDLHVERIRGGFSGGTIASMMNLLEEASRDRGLRRLLVDPYSLNPADERRGPDGPDPRGPRFDERSGRWTSPFVMAGINTRIVRRTNALLGFPYGRDFRYAESVLARGRTQATLQSVGLDAFTFGAFLSPTRWLMRRLLPRPGQGPSKEARERGRFELRLRGIPAADPDDGAKDAEPITATVAGDRDPGYGMTSVMLSESALCLALDAPDAAGGILTPAATMAAPLLDRLRKAGMTFEVDQNEGSARARNQTAGSPPERTR